MGGLKLIHVLILVLGASVSANSATLSCDDNNVYSVKRPYYPNKIDSPVFDYHFRWVPAQPGRPTLIVLPGGPGGISMKREMPALPSGFGLILTDPRGVGCNRGVWDANNGNLPDEFYTTENLALDVLAVLLEKKIDDYILYGGSYGSMVATVLAGLVEQRETPKPRALIIAGIIGEAFAPGTVFQGFLDVWEQVKKSGRVSPAILESLNTESPLGFSSMAWGRTISNLLAMGKTGQYDYLSILSGILPDSSTERREELKSYLRYFTEISAPAWTTRLYQAIACHEISGSIFSPAMDVDFSYENGELTPVPRPLCDGITLDHGFHSQDWPTTSPIYYFEGTLDPATPINQALTHFQGQTKANRTFIEVLDGGHTAFEMGLQDCKQAIYLSIAHGGQSLNEALSTCALRTQVRKKQAGE